MILVNIFNNQIAISLEKERDEPECKMGFLRNIRRDYSRPSVMILLALKK